MQTQLHNKEMDFSHRYDQRHVAEHYRNRFRAGRRRQTHLREVLCLESILKPLGQIPLAIDVASGPGRFVPVLTQYADRLIQTDISRNMLDLSREDYPLTPDRGGYVQADALRLPLADKSADLLFCHRFLNHVHDSRNRADILLELARVTRGRLVLSCLNLPPVLQMIRRFFNALRGRPRESMSVTFSELLVSAQEAKLQLVDKKIIRAGVASSCFLVFQPQ